MWREPAAKPLGEEYVEVEEERVDAIGDADDEDEDDEEEVSGENGECEVVGDRLAGERGVDMSICRRDEGGGEGVRGLLERDRCSAGVRAPTCGDSLTLPLPPKETDSGDPKSQARGDDPFELGLMWGMSNGSSCPSSPSSPSTSRKLSVRWPRVGSGVEGPDTRPRLTLSSSSSMMI